MDRIRTSRKSSVPKKHLSKSRTYFVCILTVCFCLLAYVLMHFAEGTYDDILFQQREIKPVKTYTTRAQPLPAVSMHSAAPEPGAGLFG